MMRGAVFLFIIPMMIATASTSQARTDVPPYIHAFSRLEITPECLSVHTTEIPEPPVFFDRDPYYIQTLWLENTCGKDVVITDIRHARRSGLWQKARLTEEIEFRIAYAVRDRFGFFEQKGESRVNFAKENAPCKLSATSNADTSLPCGSFVLAPNEAMGFVHDVPMVFEWDGEDGVRIRGEADLKAAPRTGLHGIENRDTGKKPFWEKEPDAPARPDAADGE